MTKQFCLKKPLQGFSDIFLLDGHDNDDLLATIVAILAAKLVY